MTGPLPHRLENERPWVPDPRLPHAFQAASPIYYRTIHHQIFTLNCALCGHRRTSRLHLAAEENDSPRWPLG